MKLGNFDWCEVGQRRPHVVIESRHTRRSFSLFSSLFPTSCNYLVSQKKLQLFNSILGKKIYIIALNYENDKNK